MTDGAQQFGLEVSEVFKGTRHSSGSKLRKKESHIQKGIDELRGEYEAIEKLPLRVGFVGNMNAENTAAIVPALVAMGLSKRPVGYREIRDFGDGLRMHVTRAFVAQWFRANDSVGWVDHDPTARIIYEIEKKSANLPRYMEAAGPDVRLLIVADHTRNSGMLSLRVPAAMDLRGFRAVYFYPYPERAIALEALPIVHSP